MWDLARQTLQGFVIIAISVCSGYVVAGELYSYVDESGVLHLTNSPPRAQRGKRWRPYVGNDAEGFGGEKPIVLKVKGRERVAYPVNVSRFDDLFREAARHYKLPFALIKAVAKVESNFNPKAVSRANAKGLMQMIDATAETMEVQDVFDPRQNIFGGARYLRLLADQFHGDMRLMVAAYNSGPKKG